MQSGNNQRMGNNRRYKIFRVEDLRLKLNRMREQRALEGGGGEPPPDPGYNYLRDPSREHESNYHRPNYRGRGQQYQHHHQQPDHGYTKESAAFRKEFNQGKAVNIKVEVETGTGNRTCSVEPMMNRGGRRAHGGGYRGRFGHGAGYESNQQPGGTRGRINHNVGYENYNQQLDGTRGRINHNEGYENNNQQPDGTRGRRGRGGGGGRSGGFFRGRFRGRNNRGGYGTRRGSAVRNPADQTENADEYWDDDEYDNEIKQRVEESREDEEYYNEHDEYYQYQPEEGENTDDASEGTGASRAHVDSVIPDTRINASRAYKKEMIDSVIPNTSNKASRAHKKEIVDFIIPEASNNASRAHKKEMIDPVIPNTSNKASRAHQKEMVDSVVPEASNNASRAHKKKPIDPVIHDASKYASRALKKHAVESAVHDTRKSKGALKTNVNKITDAATESQDATNLQPEDALNANKEGIIEPNESEDALKLNTNLQPKVINDEDALNANKGGIIEPKDAKVITESGESEDAAEASNQETAGTVDVKSEEAAKTPNREIVGDVNEKVGALKPDSKGSDKPVVVGVEKKVGSTEK